MTASKRNGKKPRSTMGRDITRATPERDERGRLQTTLTDDLLEELCRVHREGKDFRNVTAIRCGVHPLQLSRWLRRGSLSDEGCVFARLFLQFTAIEGEIRATLINEIANPIALVEETRYDESGKPTVKTVTARKTNGLQWLLERRFPQFRGDDTRPTPDSCAAADLLNTQQGELGMDAALAIAAQLAERMPPQLLAIFTAKGWKPPELPHAT